MQHIVNFINRTWDYTKAAFCFVFFILIFLVYFAIEGDDDDM